MSTPLWQRRNQNRPATDEWRTQAYDLLGQHLGRLTKDERQFVSALACSDRVTRAQRKRLDALSERLSAP